MTAAARTDVYRLIGFIESDLRSASAKFTELRSMLASGAMERGGENEVRCPECRGVFWGARSLAEHRYTVHGHGELCLTCGYVMEPDHKHVMVPLASEEQQVA